MTTYLDAIVQYGFPAVAAAIMLWMYVSDRRRANKREDMLLETALHGREGDGNGTKAVPGIRQIVQEAVEVSMNGKLSAALAPFAAEVRTYREETAWANTRATQALEAVDSLPCVANLPEQECPRDAAAAS